MGQFDNYALEKLRQLMNTADTQVGRVYKGPGREGKTPMDCATLVVKVVSYAMEKMGSHAAAEKVRQLGGKGTDLAKYLVTQRNWKAHYWCPDTKNPAPAQDPHEAWYRTVLNKRHYWKIPISGVILDYNLNPPVEYGRTPKTIVLSKFKLVPFAVGIASSGWHTFLCSSGRTYEVHWKSIGSDLYETKAFQEFGWPSGIVVVPPKTSFSSADF